MYNVGPKESNESELSEEASLREKVASKIGSCYRPMISLEETHLLSKWRPVFRQRELRPGIYVERVNLALGVKRKIGSGKTVTMKVSRPKTRGGVIRSSDEVFVMKMERRDYRIHSQE